MTWYNGIIRSEIAADAKRMAAAVPLIAPLAAIVAEYRWIDEEVIDAAIAVAIRSIVLMRNIDCYIERINAYEICFEKRSIYLADIGGGENIFGIAFDCGHAAMIDEILRKTIPGGGYFWAGAHLLQKYPAPGALAARHLDYATSGHTNMCALIWRMLFHTQEDETYGDAAKREMRLINSPRPP